MECSGNKPKVRKNCWIIFTVTLSSCVCVCVCVCLLFTAAALRIHPVITAYGTQRRGLTAYVLTQEEMIKKHFPVKGELMTPSAECTMWCPGVCDYWTGVCFQTDIQKCTETLSALSSCALIGVPGFEEFACTDSVACVTDSSPLFGLDCEMVINY